MSDDRSDLEEAIRLLRLYASQHYAPYVDAETRDFLARHPEKPTLLPCPFCGRTGAYLDADENNNRRDGVFCLDAVTGASCGARMFGGRETAIAAWNRRATPASDLQKDKQ